jgi:hypothetical protein
MGLGIAGQFLILERWIPEMARDFGAPGDHRGCGIRMRNSLGPLVQTVVILVAPLPGCGELQDPRLHGYRNRWHGNAVFVGEIRDGLDVRIVRHKVIRQIAERGHALHVLLAVGAIPDGKKRSCAGRRNVDRARQEGVVDRRASRQFHPVHLDIQALFLAFLLDEFLIPRHVQEQVDDSKLLCNPNRSLSVHRRGCAKRERSDRRRQEHGGQATRE